MSESGYALDVLRTAYHTVFGRAAPTDEYDDQILLWIHICFAVGVDHPLVRTIKRFYPALPDVDPSWEGIPLLDLSLAVQKNITASKTIDAFEFMKRLPNEAELPEPYREVPGHAAENSNAILHRREQLVTAIFHTLLSFVGFNVAPEHKTPTNKLELSKDATKCSRYLPYSIEPLHFDFVVQIQRGKVPDSLVLVVPSVFTSISWRRGSEPESTDSQVVSWGFNFAYFLDDHVVFPPSGQFDKVEDTGFRSAARFVKFVKLIQEKLLEPLWENVRENYPDVGPTDPPPEHEQSEANLGMDLQEE